MKCFFCLCLLIVVSGSHAQENISPTSDFTIEGLVKAPLTFNFNSMTGFPTVAIDSVTIYNHLHVRRRGIKSIKGILLKDILGKVEFNAPNPKVLSEFYIVCIASDNYKVVFSWNEIFNTDIGKHAIIITEAEGKRGEQREDRIALISPPTK